MTYRGHVKNGQIHLDDAPALPEGAEVRVDVLVEGVEDLVQRRRTRRIQLDPGLAKQIGEISDYPPDDV